MNLIVVAGVCFFLLLVGTLLGRYYAPDKRPLERAAREGRAYARGLVELLDGEDEAAIAEITRALRSNTETLEAYFALGTLFRQRGEYERAVRVHQALLVRRKVDKKTQRRVHYQLALDFEEAGFPRRAIKALEWVIAHDRKHLAALRRLAALYEQVSSWERAAAVQHRIARLSQEPTEALQAHLLAAQAQQEIEGGDDKAARRTLRRAISADPKSVHVLHVVAGFERRRGQLDAAVKAWRKACELAPDLLSFFGPRLEAVLFELDRLEELSKLLEELERREPANVHVQLALARLEAKRAPSSALRRLEVLLEDHPALLPARRAAGRLLLEQGDAQAVRAAYEDLLAVLDRADRGFRCARCGHAARELFWHCPGCQSWGSARVAWGRRSGERTATD